MSATADRMYCILRQLCDPQYAGPEAPTIKNAMDAVIAYEVERRGDTTGWDVPELSFHRDWHVLSMRVTYGTPDMRGPRYRDVTMSFRYKDELTPQLIKQRFDRTCDLILEEMKQYGWLR